MEVQAHIPILKRVGAVLVAVGLIDIAYMIYCIVNKMSYSSSLNLFAVIAGVLLIRGSLRTAATVRWFGVFFLSACIAALLAWPAIQPMGLTLTRIRLDPGGFVGGVVFLALAIGLFYWVIRELGREAVQGASAAAGIKHRDMRVPMACGVALVVVGGVFMILLLSGDSGARAISMAEKEVGPGYQLHVSSLLISGTGGKTSVSGVVTAGNKKEIRDIPVHWEEGANR
jgi:hypothetical protein